MKFKIEMEHDVARIVLTTETQFEKEMLGRFEKLQHSHTHLETSSSAYYTTKGESLTITYQEKQP